MGCSLFIVGVLLISCFIAVNSNCDNTVIITDFDPESCDRSKNQYYIKDIDGKCTPGCVTKIGRDERGCIDKDDCAPGLMCDDFNSMCVIDPDSDARCFYQKGTLSWTPKCLPDGTFAPKQCKGEAQNGRCYCFSKLGNRIYGEEWSNKAENMTCACSRRRSDLESEDHRTDISLHCDTKGNFEPLQCDSESCWCADPQTGDVVAAVVPEEMMTVLPCYNKTLVGMQYLRQCESLLLAQNKIKFEFSTHGTNNIMLPYVTCDFDGGYGRVKVDKGRVTCTWRDGTNIHSYATEQSQLKYVDCNCARDTKIYELVGKEMAKMCKGNGNYELLQHYENDKNFCVDNDGFITYGPTSAEINDCEKYLP